MHLSAIPPQLQLSPWPPCTNAIHTPLILASKFSPTRSPSQPNPQHPRETNAAPDQGLPVPTLVVMVYSYTLH